MLTPFTSPTSLTDRIVAVEREVERLERLHNLQESRNLGAHYLTVRVISRALLGGGLYWQFTNASIIDGGQLFFEAICIVGAGALSVGQWCDWELRYYQQVPSIYSAAEKASRSTSAHVVLASGRVNGTGGAGEVEQSVTATVDVTPHFGTYGRFEVWLGGSSDNSQERSYFSVRGLTFSA